MSSENNSFKKILEDNGYTFPVNENQVREFEKSIKGVFEKPEKWDSIDDILSKNSGVKSIFDRKVSNDKEIESFLSMAAREGKDISEEIRKKMKEDRDKANGK